MIDLKAVIEGDQDLMVKFENLTRGGQSRAMRAAMNVGMKLIREAIRTRIPDAKTPGHDNSDFRKAIGNRFVRSRGEGQTAAKVGVNVGPDRKWAKIRKTVAKGQRRKAYSNYRQTRASAPHFHLLAMGTAMRRTRLTRANRGRVKPGNFVPDAAATVAASVGSAMESELRARIYAEATKGT